MKKTLVNGTDVQEDIAIKLMYGDESVYEDIVRNIAPAIQKWLKSQPFGLTPEDAEDIVCESIMRLWERREQYDDSKGSVKVYLYRIARNLMLDRPKSNRFKTMQKERQCDDEYLREIAAPQRKKEHNKPMDSDTPLLIALREELRELPNNQRKVLIEDAGATEEMPAAQLGKILGGIPAGTIRQLRKRGKDNLRLKLSKRGFDGTKE